MNSKFLLAGVIIVLIVAIGGLQFINITGYTSSAGENINVQVTVDDGKNPITQNVVLGPRETAFNALKRVAAVDYKMQAPSVLVTEINGVRQDDNHYWLYFVNEKMLQVGCDQYYPVEGDSISFRYLTVEEAGKYFE